MTKAELLKELKKYIKNTDTEVAHIDADEALIKFINDPEITKAYNKIGKWYA